MRMVILTHSNIHVNVSQCLDGLVQCQTEKLSAFKSKKQLTKELERFWGSSDSLLVLQCKPELDASHLLLAKSIIGQQRMFREKVRPIRLRISAGNSDFKAAGRKRRSRCWKTLFCQTKELTF